MAQPIIVPVILCGGEGARLAPVSTRSRPKQFLGLESYGPTFLQMAIDRALTCGNNQIDQMVIVTHQDYVPMVHDNLAAMGLPVYQEGAGPHIIGEPAARNTAAAVCLAAQYVSHNYSADTMILVLPSDHVLEDSHVLKEAIGKSMVVAQGGKIIAFGVRPTTPSPHYGYIKPDVVYEHGLAAMAGFVEKPDEERAKSYLQQGYLWNSGIYLVRAGDVLHEFSAQAPDLYASVRAACQIAKNKVHFDIKLYKNIPAMQYDRAIMEKTDNACVFPCVMDWFDIGSEAHLIHKPDQKVVAEDYEYKSKHRSL